MKPLAFVALILTSLYVSDTHTQAQETAGDRGLQIAQEAEARSSGFRDSDVNLTMILRNSNGDTAERSMRQRVLEVPDTGRGDWSLVTFAKPRDIAGTAFLTYTNILEPDDQWLFLPALRRVKRISSANKSGPFVGSEFAYEDLASTEIAKFSHTWLRDETCGDLECHVIERLPRYENSGYTRQVVWYDTIELREIRIDYYDRKNELLKTLNLFEFHQYLDRYWRAHRLEMINHQTGKSTTLSVNRDYAIKTGLADNIFMPGALPRLR